MDKKELERLDQRKRISDLLDYWGNILMIALWLGGWFFIARGIQSFSQTRANICLIGIGVFLVIATSTYLWREYRLWCLRRYKRRRYFRP